MCDKAQLPGICALLSLAWAMEHDCDKTCLRALLVERGYGPRRFWESIGMVWRLQALVAPCYELLSKVMQFHRGRLFMRFGLIHKVGWSLKKRLSQQDVDFETKLSL